MAQRAIREYDGKRMIARLLGHPNYSSKEFMEILDIAAGDYLQITPETDFDKLKKLYPWLLNRKLVVKPDQLIKRRGKNKLLLLDASFNEAEKWIEERMNKEITIQNITDKLTHFLIEPFVPHKKKEEHYFAIRSAREGDEILFYHQGGIDVGDVDAKAEMLMIPTGDKIWKYHFEVERKLSKGVPKKRKKLITGFMEAMFRLYSDLNYAYLEINPLVVKKDRVVPLDLAAKLDDTGEFESSNKWGEIEFPSPFGRTLSKEEQYIKDLDSKTGASLKLTLLNLEGRVWTLVAGGGASVIYSDTISDLGYGSELANYGEYSGNPSEELTYQYAKTVLDLMTRKKRLEEKVLLIGGGIANFTDVAKTFKGIVRALREYKDKLQENKVKIYVRRGGPNYQSGLKMMKDLEKEIDIPIDVYGPETHMTRIVSMALK